MQNKYVIGVTGGIGSGKSEVLTILKYHYHAFVIQTDHIAKLLQQPGKVGYQRIVDLLGRQILNIDETIDRARLATLLFHDKSILDQVNEIVHPLVWEYVKLLIRHTSAALIVVESALFSENSGDICDELWYVYTSREIRLKRLYKSRGLSSERTLSIMDNQPPEEIFSALADYRINNDGTRQELKQQIQLRLPIKE